MCASLHTYIGMGLISRTVSMVFRYGIVEVKGPS